MLLLLLLLLQRPLRQSGGSGVLPQLDGRGKRVVVGARERRSVRLGSTAGGMVFVLWRSQSALRIGVTPPAVRATAPCSGALLFLFFARSLARFFHSPPCPSMVAVSTLGTERKALLAWSPQTPRRDWLGNERGVMVGDSAASCRCRMAGCPYGRRLLGVQHGERPARLSLCMRMRVLGRSPALTSSRGFGHCGPRGHSFLCGARSKFISPPLTQKCFDHSMHVPRPSASASRFATRSFFHAVALLCCRFPMLSLCYVAALLCCRFSLSSTQQSLRHVPLRAEITVFHPHTLCHILFLSSRLGSLAARSVDPPHSTSVELG
jgi:hypothetical protein